VVCHPPAGAPKPPRRLSALHCLRGFGGDADTANPRATQPFTRCPHTPYAWAQVRGVVMLEAPQDARDIKVRSAAAGQLLGCCVANLSAVDQRCPICWPALHLPSDLQLPLRQLHPCKAIWLLLLGM
jgi:hypothetical protein